MIVMPANNSAALVHYLAGRHRGLLGHLYSPGGERGPYPWLPYALDNGAFGAFSREVPWDPVPWLELLCWAKASGQAPRWVLVPDVVGDREATLRRWDAYALAAAQFGWPLAFAAQDGMSFDDVPPDAAVVFLGGGHGVETPGDPTLVRALPARPRRTHQHLSVAAGVRGRRRRVGGRHRLDARRPGTTAGARAMAARGERRERTPDPDLVRLRAYQRPDGSWWEVVQHRRTRAMWRRPVRTP